MTVTSDGEVGPRGHRRAAAVMDHPSLACRQEGAFGACRHFLDCLQRGVPAETSGEDNLKTLRAGRRRLPRGGRAPGNCAGSWRRQLRYQSAEGRAQ